MNKTAVVEQLLALEVGLAQERIQFSQMVKYIGLGCEELYEKTLPSPCSKGDADGISIG